MRFFKNRVSRRGIRKYATDYLFINHVNYGEEVPLAGDIQTELWIVVPNQVRKWLPSRIFTAILECAWMDNNSNQVD